MKQSLAARNNRFHGQGLPDRETVGLALRAGLQPPAAAQDEGDEGSRDAAVATAALPVAFPAFTATNTHWLQPQILQPVNRSAAAPAAAGSTDRSRLQQQQQAGNQLGQVG